MHVESERTDWALNDGATNLCGGLSSCSQHNDSKVYRLIEEAYPILRKAEDH